LKKNKSNTIRNIGLAFILATAALPAIAGEEEDDAAMALARKGNCFKCHAVDKRKKAPAYQEVARKYKGRDDAREKLWNHITGNTTVKLDTGDEPHEPPPTKNKAELENLIRWILSRHKE
jgi:cytochrome c